MMNETLTSIKSRRSIRAYKPEQIQEDALQAVLEAGIYAPSAMNQQPWHFTVIQNKEVMNKMLQDIKAVFAQSENERFRQIAADANFNPYYGAPTAVIVSGDEKAIAPQADCAAAMENMMVAAESLGIGSCWVNIVVYLFSSEKGDTWKKELGIPEGYRPFYSVALGYKGAAVVEAPKRRENVIHYIR